MKILCLVVHLMNYFWFLELTFLENVSNLRISLLIFLSFTWFKNQIYSNNLNFSCKKPVSVYYYYLLINSSGPFLLVLFSETQGITFFSLSKYFFILLMEYKFKWKNRNLIFLEKILILSMFKKFTMKTWPFSRNFAMWNTVVSFNLV